MDFRYIDNGISLKLDASACTGCGVCVEVCPHDVFRVENGKAEIIRREYCMECGACARNCAFSVITVNSGVGCAGAVIRGLIRGTEPDCGCGGASCG
jgi:NAD-dependent dihydropyrimidine dehydrogenase PreA subunit